MGASWGVSRVSDSYPRKATLKDPEKMPLPIVQIVRRFGPVGGMESYVWHLSQELVKLGCSVTVLCENDESPHKVTNLKVVCLPKARARPRWLALLRFSNRISRYVKEHNLSGFVIHSHERTSVHQVTTFHGPPFAHIKSKPFWKLLSIRIWTHLWLEGREVLGGRVKAVVPNSAVIRSQLLVFYPNILSRLSLPIPPAVSADIPIRSKAFVDSMGGTIGFVGKEWKRKGLVRALEIFRELKKARPNLTMLVIGVDKESIRSLPAGLDADVQAFGWKEAINFYQAMDLLLHPAIKEPFGMVVIEAMAAQVPVVISDLCGARDYVSEAHGEVVSLESGLDDWVKACERQLNRTNPPPGFERGWDRVARDYSEVYKSLT